MSALHFGFGVQGLCSLPSAWIGFIENRLGSIKDQPKVLLYDKLLVTIACSP